MSGIAAKLQQNRARAAGFGTNAQAFKFLNQDYEALKRVCLESGRLFQDDMFEANTSALGFKELGPNSSKVRGVEWMRPKVGVIQTFYSYLIFFFNEPFVAMFQYIMDIFACLK